MKRKTIFTGLVTAALVFSLEAASVLAAGPAGTGTGTYADGSGVCCYCGGDCRFVDEDGDGICDYYNGQGTYCGNPGQGYVDADGDGVCDNYEYGRCGRQRGCRGNGGRGCLRR